MPARGALAVACVTGFGGALTSTHMYDIPSNIIYHTKCDGVCYHSQHTYHSTLLRGAFGLLVYLTGECDKAIAMATRIAGEWTSPATKKAMVMVTRVAGE